MGKKLAVVLKPAHEGEDREYLEFLDTSMTQEETALALQRSMDVIRNSYWTVSNLDRSLSSSRAFLSKAYAISGKNPSDGMMDPAFDASNFHPGGFTMEEDLMGEKGAGSEIWDD